MIDSEKLRGELRTNYFLENVCSPVQQFCCGQSLCSPDTLLLYELGPLLSADQVIVPRRFEIDQPGFHVTQIYPNNKSIKSGLRPTVHYQELYMKFDALKKQDQDHCWAAEGGRCQVHHPRLLELLSDMPAGSSVAVGRQSLPDKTEPRLQEPLWRRTTLELGLWLGRERRGGREAARRGRDPERGKDPRRPAGRRRNLRESSDVQIAISSRHATGHLENFNLFL